MSGMGRREFVALLGGAAATWPLTARAQQPGRVRRIGMLVTLPENDPEETARNAILLQSLEQMGWTVGRNVQFDRRQTLGDAERARRLAVELISLMPDVILSTGSLNVGALQQATQTVPIVFTVVPDPVGAGFVDSLARPGRNATGFTQFDYSISGKWLELLKEIAPQVTRVGVLREPGLTAAVAQFAVIQSVSCPVASCRAGPTQRSRYQRDRAGRQDIRASLWRRTDRGIEPTHDLSSRVDHPVGGSA
jgi:putative ABC transport system substrate-binding protein